MWLRRFVVAMFLSAGGPALAQSSFTGQGWQEFSRDSKVIYVAGWIDGRSQGLWDTLQVIDEKRWSKGVLEGLEDDAQLKDLFSRSTITVNQLVDGIDKFYEDHRNLHVELRAVVDIVLDEISGRIVLDDEAMQRIRAIASQQHARP